MEPVVTKEINNSIRVGYSGKRLGSTYIKFGPDADENFAKFMTCFPGKDPLIMTAVGGDTIVNIDKTTQQELEATEYDAAITKNPQKLLVLNAADCIPLVFCNKKGDFVALAHIGTNGASLHLPTKLVNELGVSPQDLYCYIGPSISQKTYRFERDKFEKKLDQSWDKYVTDEADGIHINLIGYVLDELKNLGIKPKNIQIEEVDTGADPNYFSHRRHRLTGEADGRNCFAVHLL